jgi:hypothetical protein
MRKEYGMPERDNRNVTPHNGGFFQDISNRVRLIGRLVTDPRVNPVVKLLPVGTLLYVIFPDLLPMNPLDDALVLWLGTTFFVELCPKEVVAEHMRLLTSQASASRPEEDVVEGEFYEQGRAPQDPNRP